MALLYSFPTGFQLSQCVTVSLSLSLSLLYNHVPISPGPFQSFSIHSPDISWTFPPLHITDCPTHLHTCSHFPHLHYISCQQLKSSPRISFRLVTLLGFLHQRPLHSLAFVMKTVLCREHSGGGGGDGVWYNAVKHFYITRSYPLDPSHKIVARLMLLPEAVRLSSVPMWGSSSEGHLPSGQADSGHHIVWYQHTHTCCQEQDQGEDALRWVKYWISGWLCYIFSVLYV